MKTGMELIAIERQEQIEKHGFTLKSDSKYKEGELIKAALFCINSQVFEWPFNWGDEFRENILNLDDIEQLIRAGAFIAAEIDRLQTFEKTEPNQTTYPATETELYSNENQFSRDITKREYFAAMAMQGILANSAFYLDKNDPDIHKISVLTADYLISELNKTP